MMRHLLLSAVFAAAAADSTNATFGALADRVAWTHVDNKASYAWPDNRLRHFSPAEAMDLLRGRHVSARRRVLRRAFRGLYVIDVKNFAQVLGNSVARHNTLGIVINLKGVLWPSCVCDGLL